MGGLVSHSLKGVEMLNSIACKIDPSGRSSGAQYFSFPVSFRSLAAFLFNKTGT